MSYTEEMQAVKDWSERISAPHKDCEYKWVKKSADAEMGIYFILINLSIYHPKAYQDALKVLDRMSPIGVK